MPHSTGVLADCRPNRIPFHVFMHREFEKKAERWKSREAGPVAAVVGCDGPARRARNLLKLLERRAVGLWFV